MEKTASYNIKPQPCTEYGVSFDSKLERRVARFFTACGWEWKREPIIFPNWLPDFSVNIEGLEYLIEVKPNYSFFDFPKFEIALKRGFAVALLPDKPLSVVTLFWKNSTKTLRDCMPENALELWEETIY
jgi:hypothetical protein